MFVLNAIVRIIIGPGDVNFMDGHKFIMKAREFKNLTGLNEGLAIKSTQLITLITIYLLYEYIFGKNKYSTGKKPFKPSSNKNQAISSTDKAIGNFAISTFFYVNDWTENVTEASSIANWSPTHFRAPPPNGKKAKSDSTSLGYNPVTLSGSYPSHSGNLGFL